MTDHQAGENGGRRCDVVRGPRATMRLVANRRKATGAHRAPAARAIWNVITTTAEAVQRGRESFSLHALSPISVLVDCRVLRSSLGGIVAHVTSLCPCSCTVNCGCLSGLWRVSLAIVRRQQVAQRRGPEAFRLHRRRRDGAHLRGRGTRPRQANAQVQLEGSADAPPQRACQGESCQGHIRWFPKGAGRSKTGSLPDVVTCTANPKRTTSASGQAREFPMRMTTGRRADRPAPQRRVLPSHSRTDCDP